MKDANKQVWGKRWRLNGVKVIVLKDEKKTLNRKEICVFCVNLSLDDLFNFPLPKPYIRSLR